MNKLTLIFLLLSLQANAQTLKVKELRSIYQTNPIGVENPHPNLSWEISSSQREVRQIAYRIIVSDDVSSIDKNIGNIWDTKKVMTSSSIQIIYDGRKLSPVKSYYWKVMVWDNHKNVSKWSETNRWQTGLFDKADWKGAQWIAFNKLPDSLKVLPGQGGNPSAINDTLPLLRKEFTISKKLKRATAFIAGLGHFDFSLNGSKVGDHFLDAGWTQYEKTALYVPFDITNKLKQGKNTIGVMLGNGFYFIPRGDRYRKLELAYGFPKMICRVVLEYADGSSESIISNNTWKTHAGPITFTSIYGGEDYNANLEQTGWNAPNFNDKNWRVPVIVDGPPKLMAQTAPPLKVLATFTTKKITEPKPGIWVYDLGQNASAIPQLTVKGKNGATVRLKPSELLNAKGLITTKPIGTPVYFDYTLKGGVSETWQPQFTYYGFRYVQVEGAVPEGMPNPNNLPVISSIKSLHTRSSSSDAGKFDCSNELFNKTYSLIDWAIRSNMASVFTDCPTREKLGWLEEAHLVGASIRYLYDIPNLANKTVTDMMDAQLKNGLVPDIAPEYDIFRGGFRDSPEWGSNSVIMPWYLYEWYGDKGVLEKSYPMMENYMTYLNGMLKQGILTHGLGDWYDIGPNPPGVSQLTPLGLTATAIYYYDLSIITKIANMLNKPEDARKYQAQAQQLKEEFNKKYFNKQTKGYATGSQTSNAMALYMGLVEPQYQQNVLDNLVKEIKNRNNSLTTGDIGYRYLLRVLEDNGRSDVIYDMNSNSSVPGYGYQLDRGATALTESWQGANYASNNHMMLGHLMEWFFTGLGGIKSSENAIAFKNFIINPQLVGDVTFANASYLSPYGKIVSSWKKGENGFELKAEVPVNTSAVIYLPGNQNSKITEGAKEIDKTSLKNYRYQNGKILIKVGSGTYDFTVSN
nr:alpha-L-rhamnosidase [uncultured Pedobacter sp.]